MSQSKYSHTVDEYLLEGCGRCELGGTPECKVHRWTEELLVLRGLVLDSGLHEEIKWGNPCYTLEGKNVLMIAAFKECCTISFFKGVLLKDKKKLLHQHGENSQAVRIFKFTNVDQIVKIEKEIREYIREAMDIEKKGLKVEFTKEQAPMPEEMVAYFSEYPDVKKAFEALTPGRQRSYILHVSSAKQSQTRASRIEKAVPKIMAGKGFNEY